MVFESYKHCEISVLKVKFWLISAKISAKSLLEIEDSDLDDLSEGKEAFIVTNLTEKEQYNYIWGEIVKNVAHGKRSKGFTVGSDREKQSRTAQIYAEHLLWDMTAVTGKTSTREDEVQIPDDPDVPLIIMIIPSSLKLPVIVKEEAKSEGGEEGTEEKIEEMGNEGESSEDEISLDAEDKVNQPEVANSLKIVKEAAD